MTDGQPGQNQAANDAGQNAGASNDFNVTFSEGAGSTPPADNNNQNTQDNGNNAGDNNQDTYSWVPEDYREKFKADESLNRYTTQEDFIKAVLNDKAANGEAIKLPGENATDADWNVIYDKLGRPANASGYELSKELPEGCEFSEEMYNEFNQTIYAAGLSKKQAAKIYDWYNNKAAEMTKGLSAQIEASYRKSMDDAVGALKKEWGTDYQKNLDSAVAMANKFLSPETKQYLNASKLGNHPTLIKDFYNLSKQVSGAQMRGDGPSGNVSSLAELEAKMEKNLRAPDYTTNLALQQENKQIASRIAQMQSKS